MAPISKPLLYLLVNNTFDILLQIPVNEQKGERTFCRHAVVHAAASSAPSVCCCFFQCAAQSFLTRGAAGTVWPSGTTTLLNRNVPVSTTGDAKETRTDLSLRNPVWRFAAASQVGYRRQIQERSHPFIANWRWTLCFRKGYICEKGGVWSRGVGEKYR